MLAWLVASLAVGCAHSEAVDVPPLARAQAQERPTAAASGRSFTPPTISDPLPNSPTPDPDDKPLPINLSTALQLAGARPLDVQIAAKQVEAAASRYAQARLLWVPNLSVGGDYLAHSGPQQVFAGDVINSTRGSFMAGFGPNVVFGFSDALYAPPAARQDMRARRADEQAAKNDAAFDTASAYFTVQQARGELAVALAALQHAETLTRKTASLAKGLAPPAEIHRAGAELGRRKQLVAVANERRRTASAELARVLRLDPTAVVEPSEPASLPVTVIDATATLDALIPIALTTRPELAGNQAVVQAALARLKQEKLRPLIPSLAVRSVSTNPAGTLGYGVFGGGRKGEAWNSGGRFDIDMQLLWEFQSLGLGNRAKVNERRAEHELATLELFRTQDRIAAEVASAFAQVRAAAERVNDAEPAFREATELVGKTIEGLGQTRRTGDVLSLVVRPQEAVAAVQAYAQAGSDFFAAVADYNRAQFRLYRALGHPAHCLAGGIPEAATEAKNPAPEPIPEPNQPVPPALPKPEPVNVLPVRAEAPLPATPLPVTVSVRTGPTIAEVTRTPPSNSSSLPKPWEVPIEPRLTPR
jgi:outer membrane protein TolC